MTRTLKTRCNATVERFQWSGRNTHRARVRAATALANRIEQRSDDNIVIVAHSHGGNVALAATRIARATNRKRGLVTLGTPFLTSRKQFRRLRSMAVTLLIGVAASAILTLIGVVPSVILVTLLGFVLFYFTVSLYSLLSLRRLPHAALEAMVGFRTGQFEAVKEDGVRSFEPPEARFERYEPGYEGHDLEFASVEIEVVAFPSDEAGAALATGQFLGLISGTLARLLNSLTRGLPLFVYIVAVSIFLILLGLIVVVAVGVVVLVFVETGDVSAAIDRLWAMRDAAWSFDRNPAFDVIESVFPGWIDTVKDWLGNAFPVVLQVVWAIPIVVVAPLVFLAMVFAVLLVEAMTIGFDGASFIWRRPITAVSVPVGISSVSLLPVTSMGSRGLVHGNLTTSGWTVGAVCDAVNRILAKPG